jgi:hypothetical protein
MNSAVEPISMYSYTLNTVTMVTNRLRDCSVFTILLLMIVDFDEKQYAPTVHPGVPCLPPFCTISCIDPLSSTIMSTRQNKIIHRSKSFYLQNIPLTFSTNVTPSRV